MGFIFPEAGQIDRNELSTAQIGYLPEQAFYPTRFAVRDYLKTLGHLTGLGGEPLGREIDRLLAQLGWKSLPGGAWARLSRGTLQRVGLAQVLLGDPAAHPVGRAGVGT